MTGTAAQPPDHSLARVTVLLGTLTAAGGVFLLLWDLAVFQFGHKACALLAFGLAAVGLIATYRFHLRRKLPRLNMLSLYCVLLCAWYFLPNVVYAFFRESLKEIEVFDNEYLVRSTIGVAIGFLAMCVGSCLALEIYRRRRTPPGAALATPGGAVRPPDRTAKRDYYVLLALCLVTTLVSYQQRPRFNVAWEEFFLLYADPHVAHVTGRFTAMNLLWGICALALFREFLMRRRKLGLFCALLNFPNVYYEISATGRRQIYVILLVILVATVLTYRSRHALRWLVPVGGFAVLVMSLVGMHRLTVKRDDEPMRQLLRPVLEAFGTTSMHSRIFYTYRYQRPMLGYTYLRALPRLLPLPYGWLGISEFETWNMRATFETIEYAPDVNFGMGASPIAEAFVNFRSAAPLPLILNGLLASYLILICAEPCRSAWRYAVRMVVLAAVFWQFRSPVSSCFTYLRVAWVFLGVWAALGLLERTRSKAASPPQAVGTLQWRKVP